MFNVKRNELVKESIYETVLSNGLKLIVIPKKGFTKQYAIYATDYGSNHIKFYPVGKDEPVEVPLGIAHFLEHKMFETPNGVNVFEQFAKYGAQPNAFTSQDMTAYHFISTDDFYENLKILINYVNEPYFTEENVEKEKGIIGQEITMYDDEADWVIYMNLLKALYSEHPIKNDVAGDIPSITEITAEMLYLCYNNFYNPGNMVLVVAGDLDPDEVLAHAEEYIKEDKRDIPTGKVRKWEYNEPKEIVRNYHESNMDISRPKMLYGYKDNKVGLKGKALLKRTLSMQTALDIFAGKSGKLYEELYRDGLIDNTFGAGYESSEEYAFGYFSAETEKYNELTERLKAAIKEAKTLGLDEDAFTRIKKGLVGSLLRVFNRIESLAIATTQHSFAGIDIFDYYDVLNGLTIDDVNEAFRDAFDEPYSALAVIKPLK